MSEHEQEESFEDYEDAEIHLNISDGSEFDADRYNTKLFTFFGKLATRNHVFFMTHENDDNTVNGFYVFAHATIYQAIVDRMFAYEFPMELNAIEIPACDEAAYQRSIEQLSGNQDIPDFIPDDFYE